MPISITADQARTLRIGAQGLAKARSDDLLHAVRQMGAAQSQDRLGELLAVRSRSLGLAAADVEHAKFSERILSRSWLMRGTLHTVPSGDLRWMLRLLGAAMDRKGLTRRRDLGIAPDQRDAAVEAIGEMTGAEGPLTRAQIRERLAQRGLPSEGQATPHLLRSSSLAGVTCLGPERDGKETLVAIDDWLRDVSDAAPDDPAAELARRYFAAYGPATAPDFRWWSGLPAAESRRAVASIARELVAVDVEGKAMWTTQAQAERIDSQAGEPAVNLVGPFDPYLLGYAKRDLGVSNAQLKRINAGGGMIRSALLIDGVLAGVWRRKRRVRGFLIELEAFEPLSDDVRQAIDEEAAAIGRFLDLEVSWRLLESD